MFFENDAVIQAQLEKFLQRVLYTKYEYNLEKKPTENKETPHLSTKSNFKNLMSFFKQLSVKHPDCFKALISENCNIKTVKRDGRLVQDKSEITLKETVFAEIKKIITKERTQFRQQYQKVIEFGGSDKQLKAQMQASKKALMAQIPEHNRNSF